MLQNILILSCMLKVQTSGELLYMLERFQKKLGKDQNSMSVNSYNFMHAKYYIFMMFSTNKV